jgi:hypothetical protein
VRVGVGVAVWSVAGAEVRGGSVGAGMDKVPAGWGATLGSGVGVAVITTVTTWTAVESAEAVGTPDPAGSGVGEPSTAAEAARVDDTPAVGVRVPGVALSSA